MAIAVPAAREPAHFAVLVPCSYRVHAASFAAHRVRSAGSEPEPISLSGRNDPQRFAHFRHDLGRLNQLLLLVSGAHDCAQPGFPFGHRRIAYGRGKHSGFE